MVLGEDGALHFETSEGYGLKVIRHNRTARVGRYVYERSEFQKMAFECGI